MHTPARVPRARSHSSVQLLSVKDEANLRWVSASRLIGALALVVIGMKITLPKGLTAGYLIAFIMTPVWVPVVRRYVGGSFFQWLGALAAVSGVLLTMIAKSSHRTSSSAMIAMTVLILGLLASIGLILWIRQFISDPWIGILIGVGLLLGVSSDSGLFSANPWRFGYSVAVSIIAIGIAWIIGRRWVELTFVLILTIVSALNDARSSFALLLLTAVLLGWQMRPKRASRRGTAIRAILAIGGIAVVVYNLGEALILEGVLGETTQQRSLLQVETSGSLILGGRPELGATKALMLYQPWGFGSGTIPSYQDVLIAKAGMASLNYDPNNGYVERYMFGSGFEVHSLAGDFWANYGLVGLAFAFAILGYTLWGLGIRLANNCGSALVLYLGLKTAWNLLFGPLYSSLTLLTLFMGLVLISRPDAARLRGETVQSPAKLAEAAA